MMQRARLSEGESLERMVIHSNYNADPSAYLATPDFADAIAKPESQDFEYTAENERHLVPPKTSQQHCEQHGLFDPYFTDPLSIQKGYEIAAPGAEQAVRPDPRRAGRADHAQNLTDVAKTAGLPPELPSAENPVGERLVGGRYVIHREALITTPYLPDPMAGGVALRAQPGHELPGVTGEEVLGPSCAIRRAPNNELVILVTFREDWPDTTGFRVVLAERAATLTELPCAETFPDDGAPQWNEDDRVLTLFLAKGRICRLNYANCAHPALVEASACRSGPRTRRSATSPSAWRSTVRTGCSPPSGRSPWYTRPSNRSACPNWSSSRSAAARGRSRPICAAAMCACGPSTASSRSRWREWVDELDKPGPERLQLKGQLGEIELSENVNGFVLSQAVNAREVDPQRPRAGRIVTNWATPSSG